MTLPTRIEAAEIPSVELNAEVWLEIHRPNWREEKVWEKTNGWARPDRLSSLVSYYTFDGLDRSGRAPNYTGSVDAAMTLLSKGWRIVDLHEHWDNGSFHCTLAERGRQSVVGTRCVGATAAHPSLALLAAILRAERKDDE